jgi:hypothetical protein
MRATRISVLTAVAIFFVNNARVWAASLNGTQVTGALYFVGYLPNYFDPANGRVPAGYLNGAGPTVTIASNAVEFGYNDGTVLITADFTENQLVVTDHPLLSGHYNPIQMTFTNSAFSSLLSASDSFPYGGMTASLSGGVITLNWAGGSVTNGQSMQAAFDLNLPAAPLLDVQLTLTNTVVISWPAPATGFNLQRSSNLNPATWVDVTNTPTIVNDRKQVIVPPAAGKQIYRLKFP